MEDIEGFFRSAAEAVRDGGRIVIVLMHPCFRIPRQSHWQYDEAKKLQYRRIDRYLTPLTIPIVTHLGTRDPSYTVMFHRPLHQIVSAAAQAGWSFDAIEEWTSNRTSSGAKAKAENRARERKSSRYFLPCALLSLPAKLRPQTEVKRAKTQREGSPAFLRGRMQNRQF